MPRRRRAGAKRGRGERTSLFLPCLVAWVLLLCTALGLRQRAERPADVAGGGFGWIDPVALSLGELPRGSDPRWSGEFAERLAVLPPFRADDTAALARLREAVLSLSFVAEAGAPEVLWPDGLRLALRLHEPVACVPVGDRFQTVAADGTLLSGLWPLPPRSAGRWLPVLGPMRDARGLFAASRAGDWLAEDEHLVALEVALSLHEHLTTAEQALLGPVVIDASRWREAEELGPGIRLDLEGRRAIVFGRRPACDAPGELPVERKWDAVGRGLALLAEGGAAGTWELLDVRWDHPEIAFPSAIAFDDRGAPLVAALGGPPPGPGAPSPGRSPERSLERSLVR